MPQPPAHAKTTQKDHAWILAVIGLFALYDVWEAWTQVGNKSGYAHHSGWTLTVIVEVFAGYCLYAWFSAPGRRSRRMAMWSAITALTLSLVGQCSSVLAADATPPLWLQMFVKGLPVVTLALGAVLIHLRRLDRDAATAGGRSGQEAAQAEMDALRAQLATAQTGLETAQSERAAAQEQAAQSAAKYEVAARKLAAKNARSTSAAKRAAPARSAPAGPSATEVPDDVDARAEALAILAAEPGISGAQLGLRVGMSKRWGQTFKNELAAAAPRGQEED